MDTPHNTLISLETIPADRRLVEELARSKLISGEARDYALNLIYPVKNWGVWISRLLTILGVSLILSGIVYFFAFNWTKISPSIKFVSLQITLIGCLTASFYCGLNREFSGKILLLCASVIVGIFLCCFRANLSNWGRFL